MNDLWQDIRYGFRMLARAPVVSGVAALSLALGIAANTAMFAVAEGFLFSPLPYDEPDGLVQLREARPGESLDMARGVSVPAFRRYVEASNGLDAAFAYTLEVANLTGEERPEQVQVVPTTPDIFRVLGVQPFLGRDFVPGEGAGDGARVVILEHDFWSRRYLEDQNVLGRTIHLDGEPHTVVGVLPPTFDMIPANVHLFRPTDFAGRAETWSSHSLLAFGRLAPGATADRVQQELTLVSERLQAEQPDAKSGLDLRVLTMDQVFPGETDRRLVTILTFVTLFGLLIACANVANLLLGRAESRQKEVAVRTALGAGRARLIRQLLTESVVLGALAGAMGTGLAYYVVAWLRRAMPAEMPATMVPELSPSVLVATVLVSLGAGVALGLAPALHAAGSDLRDALGEGSRGGTAGRRRTRVRHAFVVGEFAVALALLTGAAFLLEAFDRLVRDDPGFVAEGLMSFEMAVPGHRYADEAAMRAYLEEVERRLVDVPAVEGVALMSSLPRSRNNVRTRFTVAGAPDLRPEEQPTAHLQSVNAEYFDALRIPLRAGRAFTAADGPDGERVAVVSESLAGSAFDGEALGRTLLVDGQDWTVVGVVADIVQDRIALAGGGGEALYLPFRQAPRRTVAVALRAPPSEYASLAAAVRETVWAVEPDQPLARVRSLDAHIDESLAGPMAISYFLTVMAAIALVLAALGIYGVMAHAVALRRREIGIRMALGAGRGSVVGMVTGSGLVLAGLGLLLGTPLAFLMYRGVRGALGIFDVPLGWGYPGGVGLALVTAAVLATWLPARRASAVPAAMALRDE